jgi:aldose 1-epimerase
MIELRAGPLRCELRPGLGGAIAGFWRDELPVLCSTPAAQLDAARLAACLPLVPFSNRIGHASVVWHGTQQPLVRMGGDPPHAIHGVASQRPWTVLDSAADSAMLAYEHRPDSAWPFAFDCSHTLRLRPDALELTLALTNQSGRPAPAGLGWHPRFAKRAGGRVAWHATGRWVRGDDQLPTVRTPSGAIDTELASLAIDDCFDGWDGLARLHDAQLQVRVRSGLTRLVVFTEPARDDLVIAPVSHVANAVHLYAAGVPAAELGLAVLQPGESLMAQMRIEVEGTP